MHFLPIIGDCLFLLKLSCDQVLYIVLVSLVFYFVLGDQLAIGKETGRRLGMGTNMYPSSALLGQDKDESIAALPVDELIEKADGFAGVFPGKFQCHLCLNIFKCPCLS